jgi:hypothetical protein
VTKIFVLFILISVSSCGDQRLDVGDKYPISFVQILANINNMHGVRVHTITYALLEFEGNVAYLNEDDYPRLITANSLWLNLPPGIKTNGIGHIKLYEIWGTVNLNEHGHMGRWRTSIDVDRIEEYLDINN